MVLSHDVRIDESSLLDRTQKYIKDDGYAELILIDKFNSVDNSNSDKHNYAVLDHLPEVDPPYPAPKSFIRSPKID